VWIGSLSPEKDPLLALHAFRAAALDGAVLRFVGDGPLRGELDELAGGDVEVIGSVPDVSPHLDWAGGLILTSRTEGLPGVVLEAAAAGLPVIAADVGGVRDAVDDGVSGWVVPAGDEAAFTRALQSLSADPGRAASFGEAGRRRVAEQFLFAHSFDRWDELLRREVDGHK
jgi:glycosyltransferase involved in cell wall biosynthesis